MSEAAVALSSERRKDAANDIDDRQHAGEKHGGVTGSDRNNVSREPDIGVEHSLQHLERIAAFGEMLSDNQGDKTDRAGAGCANAITEDSFQNERDNDRAPTNKDRGRIKVGDRRTLLQKHPRKEAESVNGKREQAGERKPND